jgi:hypothetical protein
MDGVLCNFERKWVELYGFDPETMHKKKVFRKHFNEFIKDKEFAKLETMPDFKTLMKFLETNCKDYDKEILSSTAHESLHDAVAPQKESWLKRHDIDWKVNLVPGKKHKKEYAKKHYVLIDDDAQNIEDWNDAGGIGILHKDALTTISLLKLYI